MHRQNFKKILFFSTKQIIFRVGRLNFFEKLNFIFFPTFGKITVGGLVNQLIKKFWPYVMDIMFLQCSCCSLKSQRADLYKRCNLTLEPTTVCIDIEVAMYTELKNAQCTFKTKL